jgi:hypothetical protein
MAIARMVIMHPHEERPVEVVTEHARSIIPRGVVKNGFFPSAEAITQFTPCEFPSRFQLWKLTLVTLLAMIAAVARSGPATPRIYTIFCGIWHIICSPTRYGLLGETVAKGCPSQVLIQQEHRAQGEQIALILHRQPVKRSKRRQM